MNGTQTLGTKGITAAMRHPTPRDQTLAWRCADHPTPEIFQPADEQELAAAKKVCAGCEVKTTCIELGIARQESGVWGGVLLEEGEPLAAPRRPGRPKNAAAA